MAGLSRHVPLTRHFYLRTVRSARTPHNPHSATPDGYHAERVWTIPVSLATTKGMISFPRGTEMFQFPRCPPRTLCIQVRVIRVHLIGFPHSDMSGSMLATSSPDLFAGDRVLHRPLAPRHPPRALRSLTYFQHPARPSWAGGCRPSMRASLKYERARDDRVRFAIGETRFFV